MSAPYYTRESLRLAHSLRVHALFCSNNSRASEPIEEICVVRRVDLVICGEQWATSRVADRTYSHI